MHIVMLLILIAFLIIAYFTNKRKVIAPFFLACLSITASYCLILLNFEKWDVAISGKFVLYITTALAFFGIGSVLAKSAVKVNSSVSTTAVGKNKTRKASDKAALLCILVSVVTTGLYVFRMISAAGSFALRKIYLMIVNEGFSPGFFFNQMMEITIFIAYISIYRIIDELLSKKRHKFKKLFVMAIPVLLFLFLVVVSTDRNILIRFFIFSLCMYVVLFMKYNKTKKAKRKMYLGIALIGVVAISAFYLFGKAKNYTSALWDSLSIYGGSGLYNFNLWIQEFNGPIYYGQSTFSTFLSVAEMFLSPLGIQFPENVASRFDDFIYFTSSTGYHYSSNIYSSFRPYVEDFGYFGMIIYPLLYGFVFQAIYNYAHKRKDDFGWILYAMLLYPIIFFPIQEQGIRRWHLGFFYELFWVIVVYFSVFNKKRKIYSRKILSGG
ncbi:MAG: oligosaccharide repeat unit polymerase [Clostridia bacterium]|nr:oligosaccharide repeat unit polymerase [Clostridia bacterium]